VTKLPVITVGRIFDPKLAEQICRLWTRRYGGAVRPIISDPDYVRKAIEGRPGEIRKHRLYDLHDRLFSLTACVLRQCRVSALW
jgi:2,4-dienoyl-CoA reductase-like NADH-dependent reductase (Old Yellow Enzyme family)